MSEWACPGCGREMATARDGDDPFTSLSVSQHDQEAVDFCVSACPDCVADVVAKLARFKHERMSDTPDGVAAQAEEGGG